MGLRMLELPALMLAMVRLFGRWPGLMISTRSGEYSHQQLCGHLFSLAAHLRGAEFHLTHQIGGKIEGGFHRRKLPDLRVGVKF